MNNMKSLYTYIPWIAVLLVLIILAAAFFDGKDQFSLGKGTFSSSVETLGIGGDAIEDLAYEEGYYDQRASTSSFFDFDPGFLGEIIDTTEQKVIKTGYLDLSVHSAEETANALEHVAETYGGTVTNRSLYQYEENLQGYVTLTVEADTFEVAIEEIKALATEVLSESVSADDVTETVVDLEARLRNAQAEETRYLEILNAASTVEEILLVESNLAQVRERIERYEGQLNYYETRTRLSTITVNVTEETSIDIGGVEFRPGRAAVEAVQQVVELFQDLILGLIYLVIVGGAIVVPAGITVWALRALYQK